jgi:pimeloyl-ACP methyl ester carboxylesterase
MSTSESLTVSRGTVRLAGERWPGSEPAVVLLHAGVTDRRSWHAVAAAMRSPHAKVAYDRRGFGQTDPTNEEFSHVDDLLAVLDEVTTGPAWLVGSSAGGGLALDTAISASDRVAGLVLIAPAVSGAPEPELDAQTARFEPLIDQAVDAGDLDTLNRLEAWLWLDGPAQPEGRVSGAGRDLFLDMNRTVLANGLDEDRGTSGVDAWSRLDQVRAPTTVACGDLDVPFLVDRARHLTERLPNARHQLLSGMAHLPQLENPAAVAVLIDDALAAE